MTPDLDAAMLDYIKAENKLHTCRSAETKVRNKTYINGTTGKIESDEPGPELRAKTSEAVSKRDVTFENAVREARTLGKARLESVVKTTTDKHVRKVVKEALRTVKFTTISVPIPTPAYEYFADCGVDVTDVCVKALKVAYDTRGK